MRWQKIGVRCRNSGMACGSGGAIKMGVDMIRGKKGVVCGLVGLNSRAVGADCGPVFVACGGLWVIRLMIGISRQHCDMARPGGGIHFFNIWMLRWMFWRPTRVVMLFVRQCCYTCRPDLASYTSRCAPCGEDCFPYQLGLVFGLLS